MKSDWPEGHRLAAATQFHFPECQRVELSAIIPRASESGLQLLTDLLHYDPEKRPTAQQALKYSFFQIIKRPSDTVHFPLSTSHAPQTLNGRFSNLSFSSLDNDKLIKDLEFNRTFGNHPTFQSNGMKQLILDNDKTTSLIDTADYINGDPFKNIKIENGIKFSVLNGGTLNNNSSLNNQQRLEQSLDTNRNVAPSNGFNNHNNTTPASITSASLISQMSQITQRKNFINSLQHDESATSTARVQTSDTMSSINGHQQNSNPNYRNQINNNNNSLNSEKPVNKYEYENSGKNDGQSKSENKLLQEKISDIFVNRNVGQKYKGDSIYNNKLYNGSTNEPTHSQYPENGYRNKSFYLHDISVNNNNKIIVDNGDAKVYNIFSKQRNNSISLDENGYLASKIPSASQTKGQYALKVTKEKPEDLKRGSFEDDELEKILG